MKFCFNGCSFTLGEGFSVEQREHFIYDRLLSKQFGFNRDNIAIGGSSNYTIFIRSAKAIMSEQYHCVITQWSALNRLWLSPAPNVYFFTNAKPNDFQYRDISLNKQQIEQFQNALMLLNGDYNNILDLISYCNILSALANQTQTDLVFVNGLVPWTNDLERPLQQDLAASLSNYTKMLLDFDHRNDQEIIELFLQLQKQFETLDRGHWVNLFDSWIKNVVDTGPQGHHPGIQSHKNMADKIASHLLENKIL